MTNDFRICFLAAFRFKYVIATDPLDFTYDGEIAGIPGELELYLGIIGACLPLISPPLLAIREKVSIGYSSITGRKHSDSSDAGSDSESLPKEKVDSKQQSWENMVLKSWPDSPNDCGVEVHSFQDEHYTESANHSRQGNSVV